MKTVTFFAILLAGLLAVEVSARRDPLSPKQKELLEHAERVLTEVITITDKGSIDPGPVAEVVTRRMKELGYTVVTDPAQPHDVALKVKCEQRKTWEGTTRSGGDADLPDSPSRVWKGPACQIGYLLEGKSMGWYKEVRTTFEDASQAATEAKAGDAGAYAMGQLKGLLEQYDFPVLVTADWGQRSRLRQLLDDPATTPGRKVRIMAMLGQTFAGDAVPQLIAALKEPDMEVAKSAAIALGNIANKDSIPALVEALKTGQPELQAEAAKALGVAGALHGDFSIIQPLLEALNSPDISVKTEVAWALGKLPDRQAYKPLLALQKSLYAKTMQEGTDLGPQYKKLFEAVNYSIKQIIREDDVYPGF